MKSDLQAKGLITATLLYIYEITATHRTPDDVVKATKSVLSCKLSLQHIATRSATHEVKISTNSPTPARIHNEMETVTLCLLEMYFPWYKDEVPRDRTTLLP